ncbi:hypothetical protein HDU76_003242 [Blyttiomyces sp. JEL0837]|nr:hypothetical protein HDU76_003242 [Blyttiomyces sp. JEL0837]
MQSDCQPNFTDPCSPKAAEETSPNTTSDLDTKYIPWTELIRTKYPTYKTKQATSTLAVRKFIKEHRVPDIRANPRNVQCLPLYLKEEFIEFMEERFNFRKGGVDRRVRRGRKLLQGVDGGVVVVEDGDGDGDGSEGGVGGGDRVELHEEVVRESALVSEPVSASLPVWEDRNEPDGIQEVNEVTVSGAMQGQLVSMNDNISKTEHPFESSPPSTSLLNNTQEVEPQTPRNYSSITPATTNESHSQEINANLNTKTESNNTIPSEQYILWTEAIRSKYPNFTSRDPIIGRLAKTVRKASREFLELYQLPEVRLTFNGRMIPLRLKDELIRFMEERFNFVERNIKGKGAYVVAMPKGGAGIGDNEMLVEGEVSGGEDLEGSESHEMLNASQIADISVVKTSHDHITRSTTQKSKSTSRENDSSTSRLDYPGLRETNLTILSETNNTRRSNYLYSENRQILWTDAIRSKHVNFVNSRCRDPKFVRTEAFKFMDMNGLPDVKGKSNGRTIPVRLKDEFVRYMEERFDFVEVDDDKGFAVVAKRKGVNVDKMVVDELGDTISVDDEYEGMLNVSQGAVFSRTELGDDPVQSARVLANVGGIDVPVGGFLHGRVGEIINRTRRDIVVGKIDGSLKVDDIVDLMEVLEDMERVVERILAGWHVERY